MIRWLLALGAATAAMLLVLTAARALDPFHVNISTGGQDSDGDHRLNASDPQPNVYCSEAHGDHPATNAGIDLGDVLRAAREFDKEPPEEMADANHNDQGDFLDVAIAISHFGHGPNECTRTTFWPTGFGATRGDAIGLLQAPGAGIIVVTVFTQPEVQVSDPHVGWWATVEFNELAVNAVTGTELTAQGINQFCFGGSRDPLLQADGPIIDNSDDRPGNDGYARLGCTTNHAPAPRDLMEVRFTVVDPLLDPGICLRSFGAPDYGNALWGSYTVGADYGAQQQTNLNPCNTPIATPTATNTASNTPTITSSPTITATPTPTATPTSTSTPTPTNTPTRTITPTPTNTPLPGDSDGDGCTDAQEVGEDEIAGGRRDPNYFWDFYDVDGTRDIDLNDTLDILDHFGHAREDALDELMDREIPEGMDPWRSHKSESGIDLSDALANLKSFGHSCR